MIIGLVNVLLVSVSVQIFVTSQVLVVYQAQLVIALLLREILAVQSKLTQAMVLAVSNAVAVQALPVTVVCVVSISPAQTIVVEFTVFMFVPLTNMSCFQDRS